MPDPVMNVLAADLGKTGCRAALWSGERRAEAEGPGAPGLAFAGGVAAAEAAILAVARLLGGERLQVCVGAAGALSAPDAPGELARRLLCALPAAEVAVTSDAVIAHAGALGGTAGVVLSVGTGTVALAAAPGVFARVDGCGPWLGDEGSGAAIGLAGLRAVLRAEDGRGPATALTAAAAACFRAPAAALPALLGNGPGTAREAATFAGPVVAAAAEGDAVASAVLDAAILALTTAVDAAIRRSGLPAPVPLVLTGGVFSTGPIFGARLRAALRSLPVQVVPALGAALDGARLLAQHRSTLLEAHVTRIRGWLPE